MNDPALRRWAAAGVIGLLVVLIVVPLSRMRDGSMPSLEPGSATFVGTAACVDCHRTAAEAWTGSDHDLAMDLATEETVLGNGQDNEEIAGRSTQGSTFALPGQTQTHAGIDAGRHRHPERDFILDPPFAGALLTGVPVDPARAAAILSEFLG